jgi:hypothetical protein
VLLAACSGSGSGSGSTKTTSNGNPSASPWSIYVPGSATPSPAPLSTVRPSTVVSPLPALSIMPPSLPVAGSGTFTGSCTGGLYAGKLDPLAVVPGTGSAAVSWQNLADPSITSYRVAAVSQDLMLGTQPPPTWVTITAGPTCAQATVTVSGLRNGGRYVFWLDAVVTRSGREYQVGESTGITVR